MDSIKAAYPHVKSIKVIVEERRIDLALSPSNWRTSIYTGIDELPTRLAPAFASTSPKAEVNLNDLVRQACDSGKPETRIELPYPDGVETGHTTILRSVLIHLTLRRDANATRRPRPRLPATVAMPLLTEAHWSRYELQKLERHLSHKYAKLTPRLIELVVRLARLEVSPAAGPARLARCAEAILDRRTRPAAPPHAA